MELKLNYYNLKLIGILLLSLFHGISHLGAFQYPLFKFLNPYYDVLFPFILIIVTLFFALGVYKKETKGKDSVIFDKALTFVGGFFHINKFCYAHCAGF